MNDFTLRPVDKFNPFEFLVNLEGSPENPPAPYLMVKHRLDWFWVNNPNGRISTDIVDIGGDRASVKAEIYSDKNSPVPDVTAYGTRSYGEEGSYSRDYLQNAATTAIGKALDYLGYNIRNVSPETAAKLPHIDGTLDEGRPVDGKPPVNATPVKEIPTPVINETKPEKTPAKAEPKSEPAPVVASAIPTTIEEAKQVVITSGSFKGRTMDYALKLPNAKKKILPWFIDNMGEATAEHIAAQMLMEDEA